MLSLTTFQEQYLQTYGALIARATMGITFIIAGVSKFIDIPGTGTYIERAAHLPYGMVFATLAATLEVVGGLALIVGVFMPIVCLLLLGFALLTSYFFHYPALWEFNPAQQIMFMKNLAIAAGLLALAAFGPGRGIRFTDLTQKINRIIDEPTEKTSPEPKNPA